MTTTDGTFTQIQYEVEDRIAVITLDRPTSGNAFTQIMRRELRDGLELADQDDDVRAVVLTGAGKHFCVGADLAGNTRANRLAIPEPGRVTLSRCPS